MRLVRAVWTELNAWMDCHPFLASALFLLALSLIIAKVMLGGA